MCSAGGTFSFPALAEEPAPGGGPLLEEDTPNLHPSIPQGWSDLDLGIAELARGRRTDAKWDQVGKEPRPGPLAGLVFSFGERLWKKQMRFKTTTCA